MIAKKVLRVIVVHNNELLDENGKENENLGIEFCKSLYGSNTNWVQTSYNNTFRKNYAGFDYEYDFERDAFIPPKPYNSWILNEDSCTWIAPIPYPENAQLWEYGWDESTQSWITI